MSSTPPPDPEEVLEHKMNVAEDPITRKRRKVKERKARWLAKQSQESLKRIRAADAAAHRLRIKLETPEQCRTRREADAASHRLRIKRETPEQSQARREADAACHRLRIERKTPKHSQARREADSETHRFARESHKLLFNGALRMVEEGSPFGGAECEGSSPEQTSTPTVDTDQNAENTFPFDNLAVEFYEDPGDNSEGKDTEVTNSASDEVNTECSVTNNEILNDDSENAADSTGQNLNVDTPASDVYDTNVSIKEEPIEPDYKELQRTYIEDFIYSNTSSFDEGSNSNFDDTREEPKGSPLSRFPKIMKAIEIADYETLQILYQLLYQRSAWDTQEILTQRILEFSGFNFNPKSEDFFNREMMLRTQPDEVLVKIGAILGLDQIQMMFSNMSKGRVELISAIMVFLSRPAKKSRNSLKPGEDEHNRTPPKVQTKCGCRSRCFKKFVPAERKRLLEYTKELEEKNFLDSYLVNLIECKKIIREPGSAENAKKLKEVTYNYKCRFGNKVGIVCKPAFLSLHGLKMSRVNQIQNKLKAGTDLPTKMDMTEFPPILEGQIITPRIQPQTSLEEIPPKIAPSRLNQNSNNCKKVWISSEEQVRILEEDLKASIGTPEVVPKVIVEKCDLKKAISDIKDKKSLKEDDKSELKEKVSSQNENKSRKLKDFPLVVKAIGNASEELLLDVHFLLFLNSAEADKVRDNILEFEGFTFDSDTEEYDERIEFLQRMSSKIVSDVAISFSLEILSTKESTIKNILTFLSKPDESFLRITSSNPLSLSDVEFDDIGDMSDSDVSITCEVVEKKVECIDLLSSGEESDREDKPRKEKKASPQKTLAPPKQIVPTVTRPPVMQTIVQKQVIAPMPVAQSAPVLPKSTTPGNRKLRNFETICKIVNTHPHEYLVDIYDLLYLQKHEPSTLRNDILDFSGFTFDKTSTEYVKRKQLLDRMLYNSVRRIYNTLIHNTTEVKVFSKPTMITEIFQFLFNLPDHDTSIRVPPSSAKPVTKPPVVPGPPVVKNVPTTVAGATQPGGVTLPNQTGKLSDLKRVFQRVACFPCEYLIDVHKLLFMTDCDSKVIRSNIFAFKGFSFGTDSQEFQQRKMYLEYLTFHSLRKISSVLTTRSVDLRNSTKHELATHLTQVLAEYCNTYIETDPPESDASNQSKQAAVTSNTPVILNSAAVENIVVTPIIDPAFASPSAVVESSSNPVVTATSSTINNKKSNATSKAPVASQPLPISIIDARSVNSPAVTTTTSSRGRRKRKNTPAKSKEKQVVPQSEPMSQFADINLPEVEQYRQLYGQKLNIYQPNIPTFTGIATFNSPGGVPQILPMVNAYTQPIQVQPSQLMGLPRTLGPTIVTQVPSKQGEIIVPGECLISEPEEPASKKSKHSSSPEEPNSFHNKIRDAIHSEDEDCDKPLSSLVGHPIDSVLKKHIVDIVEQSDLASITINGVIQKIFNMYPKFDLSYRKEFIKSTLRSMLYRLGDKPNSEAKRDTNSPDCSVTTTDHCDSDLNESPKAAMECS